jgi:hypothetical protein
MTAPNIDVTGTFAPYSDEINHIPFTDEEEAIITGSSTSMLVASAMTVIVIGAAIALVTTRAVDDIETISVGLTFLGVLLLLCTSSALFTLRASRALRAVITNNDGDQAYLASTIKATRYTLIAQLLRTLVLIAALGYVVVKS